MANRLEEVMAEVDELMIHLWVSTVQMSDILKQEQESDGSEQPNE